MADTKTKKAKKDPRITAARPDLAAEHLRDQVSATHYAKGITKQVIQTKATLKGAPDTNSPNISELLFSEEFTVYEEKNGWSWGQCLHDQYVGYIQTDALGAPAEEFSHRIWVGQSLAYETSSFKHSPSMTLPLGCYLNVPNQTPENGFVLAENVGWVFARHLIPASQQLDHMDIALMFLGAPYLWGGRSAQGIDCSGLVQVCLSMAGIIAPRDTDQQQEALSSGQLKASDLTRGDIVFFKGHVGLMLDSERLLHANAYHMQTVIEPLDAVVQRLRPETPKPITALGRPSALLKV